MVTSWVFRPRSWPIRSFSASVRTVTSWVFRPRSWLIRPFLPRSEQSLLEYPDCDYDLLDKFMDTWLDRLLLDFGSSGDCVNICFEELACPYPDRYLFDRRGRRCSGISTWVPIFTLDQSMIKSFGSASFSFPFARDLTSFVNSSTCACKASIKGKNQINFFKNKTKLTFFLANSNRSWLIIHITNIPNWSLLFISSRTTSTKVGTRLFIWSDCRLSSRLSSSYFSRLSLSIVEADGHYIKQ